jgi:hypothetical protein
MMEQLSETSYGQPPRDPAEKRSSPRYPFSPAVEALEIEANARIVGRLSDIARNGCYMDTISPFAPQAAVTLTITSGNQSFKTQAKVVYSQIGMGMGLSFTTAEPEQLAVLGRWLVELCGGKPAEQDAPNLKIQADLPKRTDRELGDILRELIALLNRKNVVNDSEGMALLRKLSE